MRRRILIVEDDAALGRVLSDNFGYEGFSVEWAANGQQAIDKARSFAPDLIVLDLTLPDTDGFDLFGILRQGGQTPIIVLTARAQKPEKLKGLQLGADDYVTKPFDLDELLARVHAVLRRSSPGAGPLVLGGVVIDFQQRTAFREGEPIHLTYREFELLHYLFERPSRVIHRDELLREVWGYPEAPFTRAVDHAVARLRKKIESDPAQPQFIHTVHGDGYSLTV